jgi:lysophospholipase L1-like esterase
MGDSYPDEYQFYAPDRSTARNFVEQLAEDRGLNFGQFTETPRPEPRDAGFEFNWARSGDTSADMIAHGQHTGLAAQVASGDVKNVFLFIGGNDLRGVFSAADPVAAVQEVVPTVLTNINIAVQTLVAANPNVRIVIATVPGVGVLPEARGAVAAGVLPQALVDAVDQAAAALNDQVRQLADQSANVAAADVAGLVERLFSQKRPHVGRIKLDRDAPSNDPSHLFLGDGIHAGTIGQGLLANEFVRAFRKEFGVGPKPLRNREILENAAAVVTGNVGVTPHSR